MSAAAVRAVPSLLSLIFVFCVACGGSPGDPGGTNDPGGPADPGNPGGPTGPTDTCKGTALPGLAPDHLLIGAKSVNGLASQPGFDIEYQYIAPDCRKGAVRAVVARRDVLPGTGTTTLATT